MHDVCYNNINYAELARLPVGYTHLFILHGEYEITFNEHFDFSCTLKRILYGFCLLVTRERRLAYIFNIK